jgi:hypothetical protein
LQFNTVSVSLSAGAGLFGALSSMMGLSNASPGSPRATLRALNTELATWETLAQVRHYIVNSGASSAATLLA